MITNKDLSIDSKNGKVTLNGNKYDLGTQGEIDAAVKDVYSVMGEMGAKNLNIFPYKNGAAGDTWTSSGITYTVNADGTIEANGTATADSYFRCGTSTDDTNPIYLEAGKSYILSGTGTTGVGIILRDSNNLVATAGETDVVYNCTTSGKYYVLVLVRKEKVVDHYTIKPMLRLASDTDNTYQPYAKTNRQLTEVIGDLSQTGLTGDSVAEQLSNVSSDLAIIKVPNSFITLESGISITTNQLFKQGNHIFGWITFSFSAQKPNNLKLGTLNTGYTTNYMVRMIAGLGTEAWASEYMGYAVKGTDNGIYINGYNNNIKAAHIHLDYVIA